MPGSTWEQALLQGREEGREEGELLKALLISMTLMKEFPSFPDKKIAKLTKIDEKIVKDLRAILQKTSKKKAKKAIVNAFFKDLKLTEKQELELIDTIDLFYKKSGK